MLKVGRPFDFAHARLYTQNFDVENRLASVVVSGQTTFVYDADGALVKKVKPDGTSTLYLGGYDVELGAGGAVTQKTSYYPAGGAMRVDIVERHEYGVPHAERPSRLGQRATHQVRWEN